MGGSFDLFIVTKIRAKNLKKSFIFFIIFYFDQGPYYETIYDVSTSVIK